ncbi:hypothetical protein KHP60_24565 [Microvirga sp. 3-52]|uniref:hypothetical protein n=1 Tax=Microvirga sp. 3-52 TaxID=2792425 RepID=UPI001ACA3264|nr:hypothetical protein [Microvirga sp. 3-52]MBO1909473.1 hypothetical protein [Microvirga sp. 3-52]MBS7455463.1 hypothetical protein [Microvirga sp. 3-52]
MHEALIGYYPKSAHDEIASLLGKSPHQLDDDFQAEIAEVLFMLDNGDALRQSPQKHSRDALQLISTRARALVEALKSINEEAWWVLDKEFSERKKIVSHGVV